MNDVPRNLNDVPKNRNSRIVGRMRRKKEKEGWINSWKVEKEGLVERVRNDGSNNRRIRRKGK